MNAEQNYEDTRDWLEKARGGDAAAFGTLVKRYEDRLEMLIQLRVGAALRGRVQAEDVLQETYLKAFEALHQFQWRGVGSFYRWLGSIAEHVIVALARHHLQALKRAASRERPLEQDPDFRDGDSPYRTGMLGASGTSPSQALRRKERFERLEAALKQLSPDHREVIILARVRELPIREIAEQMERSTDAVSMLLLRALRQLKSHFGTTDSFNLPDRRLNTTPGSSHRRRGGASHRTVEPWRSVTILEGLETQLTTLTMLDSGTTP